MSVAVGRQGLGARERQEDAYAISCQSETDPATDYLIVLADGMGGHVGGEVASRIVIDTFERHCIAQSRNPKPAGRLFEAMEVANAALRERIAREPQLAGMGSTLVAAMKLGSRLYWLSVGDSALYLLRGGVLRRLNADHSVRGELAELVRAGKIRSQDAEAHQRKNALRSALIGEKIALVDANSIQLERKDILLLASDGLETLDESRIRQILSQPGRSAPQEIAADLLNAVDAARAPRQDNTTVVVARYDPSALRLLSTRSLFDQRNSLLSKVPPAAAIGGAALLVAGLTTLIYLIGWGGETPPAPGQSAATEDATSAKPAPDAASPKAGPHSAAPGGDDGDRERPGSEAPGLAVPETPPPPEGTPRTEADATATDPADAPAATDDGLIEGAPESRATVDAARPAPDAIPPPDAIAPEGVTPPPAPKEEKAVPEAATGAATSAPQAAEATEKPQGPAILTTSPLPVPKNLPPEAGTGGGAAAAPAGE
ncbi:protein phosphatase 2C domain-containing protein [Rhodobacter capsulatus]|uniref:PP2C family protein-serine/threonine phosphatase n=1 Tax=Rhodobacter capsulatus TaxID=1061 RepID=UPI0006DD2393|nr:protein phosphatase 2C domain-containing protein [Rhodobacter capsulatus]KQB12753.1 hypothetical protein AP073_06555 [Rhodobacter capsulatus]KQB15357.1 hypothetical protein AP071_14465 [Rhodobacter capsulatus]PZX26341.1 serine/threonine protein phosphatase PrpC [Rhodobacter capsulatus]QNR61833.1 protein phosphatase 2C domain-containing protein [Rhodobacter capsulatus]